MSYPWLSQLHIDIYSFYLFFWRLWDVGKSEPIKVGKASPCEGTLPGAIYFILKYQSFKAAAQANAMVGGDNASRAIPIGTQQFNNRVLSILHVWDLYPELNTTLIFSKFCALDLLGIVLGAYEGMKGIPGNWLDTMTETAHINKILGNLPLSNETPPHKEL